MSVTNEHKELTKLNDVILDKPTRMCGLKISGLDRCVTVKIDRVQACAYLSRSNYKKKNGNWQAISRKASINSETPNLPTRSKWTDLGRLCIT